jgi:hypothetical protein
MLHTYVVSDARIIATFGEDGGAIVEHVPRLECSEGRRLHSHGDETYTLEYIFDFGVADCPDPEAGQSVEARIVITGRHDNGFRMEIRGHAWIGYDNLGNVEGTFYTAPVIITEESFGPEEPEDDDGQTPEEFAKEQMRIFDEMTMPQQFQEATKRFPAPSDHND